MSGMVEVFIQEWTDDADWNEAYVHSKCTYVQKIQALSIPAVRNDVYFDSRIVREFCLLRCES